LQRLLAGAAQACPRPAWNRVVAAEKEAEANVIRRREEAAATRAPLDTAKVMAEGHGRAPGDAAADGARGARRHRGQGQKPGRVQRHREPDEGPDAAERPGGRNETGPSAAGAALWNSPMAETSDGPLTPR